MTPQTERALKDLAALGFAGRDVYLAELIPAVEMAWADGVIARNELALLEEYCLTLTARLNLQAGATFFSVDDARRALHRLIRRRLTPAQRITALMALKTLSLRSSGGDQMRLRMLEWAEAVAVVDGSPVWDTRELFWLQAMKRNLEAKS